MTDISKITLPNGQSYNIKDTTARNAANSAVPNTRTVNGKALSSDISLDAGDVGAYTKKEIDTKISAAIASAYKYKGSVTADKLPTSGQVVGDIYNITNDSSYGKAGMNVAWTGTAWDALGSNVDLSNYVTTSDSRLSNARPASDVQAWAKAAKKPSYSASEINGLGSLATKNGLSAGDVGAVSKSGDTMTGNLTAPVFQTGTEDANYFQCKKFRGEGDADTYYHAIDFGYANHNQVDFYEHGGKYVFHQHTGAAKTSGDIVIGEINSNGFVGKVNGHTVNSDVPSGAKFTDTVTTVTTTGSGNAVTAISVSNGALTVTKGTTFLTSHQDISGKADKSATVSTVSWDSTNKKLTKTINGTTSDVVTGATILGGLTKSQVTTALGYTPPTTDTNTHRPIQVNGTEVLGNNTTALNLKAGSNVSLSNSSGTVTIAATDTNTWRSVSDAVNSTSSDVSASSKAVKTAYDLAASKTSNTGTVTSVATGVGLTGGTITGSGTLKANLKSETARTIDALSVDTSTSKLYPVVADKSGHLAVGVPWTDTDTDTKNTAGSTNTSSKIFLIGATSQAANPQTYSQDTAYVGTDGCLYSGGSKVRTEDVKYRLWYKNVSVSAINGSIIDLVDSDITDDYALEGNNITWGNPSAIASLTQWSTDTAGHFIVTGNCTSATTATFALVMADKKTDYSQ